MVLEGHKYILETRKYLDYLEEHFDNIEKAFDEVTKACFDIAVVADEAAWQALKHEVEQHDLSKFSMEEFTQYRDNWFPIDEVTDVAEYNFKAAWNNHLKFNTHHWESIRNNPALPGVTERDLIHMIIDWTAMSYFFGGTAQSYYEANTDKIGLKQDQIDFIDIIFKRLRNKQ